MHLPTELKIVKIISWNVFNVILILVILQQGEPFVHTYSNGYEYIPDFLKKIMWSFVILSENEFKDIQ